MFAEAAEDLQAARAGGSNTDVPSVRLEITWGPTSLHALVAGSNNAVSAGAGQLRPTVGPGARSPRSL